MDNKINGDDIIGSLTNQIKDYSIKLAHADALLAKREKQIKELEMENKQLHENAE